MSAGRRWRPRGGVDVDGVLAAFIPAWCKIAEEMTGLKIPEDRVGDWHFFPVLRELGVDDAKIEEIEKECVARQHSEGFCRALEVIEGAKEGIQLIKEVADVFIVTSHSYSPFWVPEREEWLEEHFGVDRKHVVHTHSKFLIDVDFLVDDKWGHIEAWVKDRDRGLAFLWATAGNTKHKQYDQRYDGQRIFRTSSWGEVRAIVHNGVF